MLCYNTPVTVEQHTHRLLGTPYGFILIVDLYTLFLSLNLEDQELGCAKCFHKACGSCFAPQTLELIERLSAEPIQQ